MLCYVLLSRIADQFVTRLQVMWLRTKPQKLHVGLSMVEDAMQE